jgi:2-methylcitrate dehydratase
MESISRRMAQFAGALSFEDIPKKAQKEAKRFLLDSIGCALAALNNTDMQAAYSYIQALGGTAQASIIGHGTHTNMPNAALMNALLIRAMDYNDIYWKQDPSHPSDIISAALAPAEYQRASGKDLIVGIIIAYELEMRMCLVANPGIREVGWHHATLTQFVSPLVAGRMLGLSEDADPMATEAGVRAAMLARTGYSGPIEVFEGKEGLFEVLSNVKWDPDVLFDGLGKKFLITECGYKAFPTEALTHQPITATLELVEEHRISPHNVSEVIVETTTRGADILSDPSKYDPTTKETADHSLPYCIAVAIAKKNVLPSDFEDAALKDPSVRELLPKIKVVANPQIDKLFPKVKRAIVSIKTKNWETYSKQEDYAKGRAERPLSNQELIAKFQANAEQALPEDQLNELLQATLKIDEFNDLHDYMPLLYRQG